MRHLLLVAAALAVGLFSEKAQAALTIEEAFPALSFTQPVDLQNAGDGSNRLFVVEQAGLIYVFDNDSGVTSKSVFLDITDRVDNSSTEEGLLGLAFHPDYEDNGYFYVNYTSTNPDRTRISRFSVSAGDSNVADPGSELILLEIDRPYANHNAGQLAFGPTDGYLYITTGDGGSGGDPLNNGQNRQTLLGSILRVDVDTTDTGLNYAIPPDNPFVGNTEGYREEIFAYGMRNPWRMSFDPATGWLWAGDVGQDAWEEVDIIESGRNYGWRIMEGTHCYNPPSGCDTTGLTLPVWEYSHTLGYAVTGGYVYHGCCVPELAGKYVYGDYGSGRIWSLEYDGVGSPVNTELLDTSLQIPSFGLDEAGDLYICAFDGKIYRFAGTSSAGPQTGDAGPASMILEQNRPNPFESGTVIGFSLTEPRAVKLEVLDVSGRVVSTLSEEVWGAGRHTLEWSGKSDAGLMSGPGIYFISMQSGKFRVTRKMLLVQ